MPYESSRRAWAEIDLGALERNLGRIRRELPERIRYIAVVKADAYGHGMAPVVARLMQSGADAFAVANVHEAAEIREIGTGWPILLLSALLPEEDAQVIDLQLEATVSSIGEVQRLDALASKRAVSVPVHLKIDTGMGRLGVWHTQAAELLNAIEAARGLRLAGVYTHFSSADRDPDFTQHQRGLLLDKLHALQLDQRADLVIHADNSAGLETFSPDAPFNAVRIGLLQYGLAPYEGSLLAGLEPEPVLSFHTRVGLVKEVPAGTAVSYGRTRTLERDTRIAILTAGYGDGIPTASSNRGQVLLRGQFCPILGRVTMDQTLIDVTDLEAPVTIGDEVVLIGRQQAAHIHVETFSRWGNCIPWETLCSITRRVPRVYRTGRGQ
ncbi:MAG: alanine racemase [Opitutales bacterium]